MNIDQIIHCKRYQEVCDQNWCMGDEITGKIIHVDTDSIPQFFEKLKTTNKRVVVVSSCCDFGVCVQRYFPVYKDIEKAAKMFANPNLGYNGYEPITLKPRCNLERCKYEDTYSIKCYSFTSATFNEIPENVIRWYTVNNSVYDSKIVGIPFGVNGVDGIKYAEKICNYSHNDNRYIDFYVNFGFHTFDRVDIYDYYNMVKDRLRCNIVVEQNKDYDHYLNMLSRSKFVICPAGNGIDCFRTLESIYMGAMPIISLYNHAFRAYSQDSILVVPSLLLSPYDIPTILQRYNKPNAEIYNIGYWKGRFNNEICSD